VSDEDGSADEASADPSDDDSDERAAEPAAVGDKN